MNTSRMIYITVYHIFEAFHEVFRLLFIPLYTKLCILNKDVFHPAFRWCCLSCDVYDGFNNLGTVGLVDISSWFVLTGYFIIQ